MTNEQGHDEGVIERFFDCLMRRDWGSFGELLSPDVERVGAFGDRMVGRDPYVEMMAMAAPDSQASWVVHRIVYAPDKSSGFARVTAYPTVGRPFEETLMYTMDDEGLVRGVEVFWQTPPT